MPPPKKEEQKAFVTSLVTPEELKEPAKKPEKEKEIPGLPKQVRPLPLPPVMQHATPKRPNLAKVPHPPSLPPAKQRFFPEKPLVPGEGKEEGRPLPEGVAPKSGKGGQAEEGPPKKESGTELARKPRFPGKSGLFDQDVIGKVARENPGKTAGPPSGRDGAVTFDTSEYRYAGYMRKLREKIESIWAYPPEAAEKGIYGDLKIQFTIKKDGRLGPVELVRTSGYKMLDDAAIKALRDGEPYWPLPDSWGMDSYTIVGHFVYSMYGYQQIR